MGPVALAGFAGGLQIMAFKLSISQMHFHGFIEALQSYLFKFDVGLYASRGGYLVLPQIFRCVSTANMKSFDVALASTDSPQKIIFIVLAVILPMAFFGMLRQGK